MRKISVPREINNPITIFWFEMDEILIMIISYAGMLFLGGKVLMWVIAGIVSTIFYIRLKRRKSQGFLKHLLYYSFGVEIKYYPSGLIRNFKE
jgi:type IV conjugative transfer system protein TraL